MSILIITLEVSPLLLLLLLQMQCIHGKSEDPQLPLLRLNEILTNRIDSMVSQYKDLRDQSDNKESPEQYKRLAMAAALPVAQLDEKIRAYNAYMAHDMEPQRNELRDHDASLFDNSSTADRIGAESYPAFEQRVLKVLQRLGVYDSFTERVFRAILSDKRQLRKLKKKLDELDDDQDCCFWDTIFGLF